MAIQFNCPNCNSQIRVRESSGGKLVTCPGCPAKFVVPKVQAKAEENADKHPTQIDRTPLWFWRHQHA